MLIDGAVTTYDRKLCSQCSIYKLDRPHPLMHYAHIYPIVKVLLGFAVIVNLIQYLLGVSVFLL